jgi:ferredoxin-NADP reductase
MDGMPIYKLKLIERREIARNTLVFLFEKPEGFSFQPGQYGGFTLIDPKEMDDRGITRRFSILSTPEDKHVAIAIRCIQPSAFKRVLSTLPIGQEIKFAGPTGSFVLHADKTTPAVFIAGGIGITPFYSMIRDATFHQSTQPIFLFYGNHQIADAAFLDELNYLQQQNPYFKMIPVLDKPDVQWHGEVGFINHILINKYIRDLSEPIFYVCGSPGMVTVIQETLAEMGIDEDKIRVEDFPGY